MVYSGTWERKFGCIGVGCFPAEISERQTLIKHLYHLHITGSLGMTQEVEKALL